MTEPHARASERADRLEQAIDRAVADLAQVDPAPGLRRRVALRLAAPAPTRWPWFAGYGLAGAALAALVLIVAMPGRNARSEPPRPGTASSTVSGDAGATRAPAGPAVAPRPPANRTADTTRPADRQTVAALPPAEVRYSASVPVIERPPEGVARERGRAMLGAALTSDAALVVPLVVPDAGAAGSRQRPDVRVTSEAPEPSAAGVTLRGKAREEGAAPAPAVLVSKPNPGPAPQLEIKELFVPPLEVEPLHVDPLAPTERQP